MPVSFFPDASTSATLAFATEPQVLDPALVEDEDDELLSEQCAELQTEQQLQHEEQAELQLEQPAELQPEQQAELQPEEQAELQPGKDAEQPEQQQMAEGGDPITTPTSRKRTRNSGYWAKNVAKHARQAGEAYVSLHKGKGQEGKWLP